MESEEKQENVLEKIEVSKMRAVDGGDVNWKKEVETLGAIFKALIFTSIHKYK